MVTLSYPTANRKILTLVCQWACWISQLPLYLKTRKTQSLPQPEHERQWRVNDFWSCIKYNQGGDCMLKFINDVFATFHSRGECDTLPTLKRKCASTTFIIVSQVIEKGFVPCIREKYFCLEGMAPSDWTGSVRAVRDTPVADYSAPGLNTTRRIAYRPPIAVLPFLLALSVFYFRRTLWRWRPTVTIRRNGFTGHALASGLQCDGWLCENYY